MIYVQEDRQYQRDMARTSDPPFIIISSLHIQTHTQDTLPFLPHDKRLPNSREIPPVDKPSSKQSTTLGASIASLYIATLHIPSKEPAEMVPSKKNSLAAKPLNPQLTIQLNSCRPQTIPSPSKQRYTPTPATRPGAAPAAWSSASGAGTSTCALGRSEAGARDADTKPGMPW